MWQQSWLGTRFDRNRLVDGFPRITQKYRKPSTKSEEFRALVPRADLNFKSSETLGSSSSSMESSICVLDIVTLAGCYEYAASDLCYIARLLLIIPGIILVT